MDDDARHALAKEALLKFLDRAEIIKVHNFSTASEICYSVEYVGDV